VQYYDGFWIGTSTINWFGQLGWTCMMSALFLSFYSTATRVFVDLLACHQKLKKSSIGGNQYLDYL